jgi:hypothetical protein
MLLLESRKKLLYLPDPCYYCRISTGGNLSRNRETARGLLSLSVAMLRRAGTKDYGIQLALSPPPLPLPPATYLAKETTTAS